MTVVVWVKRHFLAEGVHIAEQLEIGLVGLPFGSQGSRGLTAGLGDLVDLEDPGLVVEDAVEESKYQVIYCLNSDS